MVIDSSSITRLAPIALIGTLIVGGVALATGAVWALVLLFQALALGLHMLVDLFGQLSEISAGTPVLHFLLLVAVLCIIARLVYWSVAGTCKYVLRGVRHVS